MLLALASLASADLLDSGGLGGMVGVHDSGEAAVGPVFLLLAGDATFWALMAPESPSLPLVRNWGFSVGGWAPMYLSDAKTRRLYRASLRNQKPGDPTPPPPEEHLFAGAPRLEVGGSAWDGERFHATLGGLGLLNLGHLAKVHSADGYVGPSFGGATTVRYLDDAHAGSGSFDLFLGLDAGAKAGEVALFRLHTAAQLDPFVADLRVLADALVGVSLVPVEVPLMIQLRGQGALDPEHDWSLSGTTTLSIAYTPD